jgi:hypothetical protein
MEHGDQPFEVAVLDRREKGVDYAALLAEVGV